MQKNFTADNPPLAMRIETERCRLEKIFTKIPLKTRKAIRSLIANAAFMSCTLEDLREEINVKGVTEVYTNGANQSGVKKSSYVEVYNTMIKHHYTVMKQLVDLLPKPVPEVEDDGFDDFINRRDKHAARQ